MKKIISTILVLVIVASVAFAKVSVSAVAMPSLKETINEEKYSGFGGAVAINSSFHENFCYGVECNFIRTNSGATEVNPLLTIQYLSTATEKFPLSFCVGCGAGFIARNTSETCTIIPDVEAFAGVSLVVAEEFILFTEGLLNVGLSKNITRTYFTPAFGVSIVF